METTLFICSLVACIIGVLTFVVGMNSRAKSEGVLLQKVDQALKGIEDLKSDVKFMAANEQKMELQVEAHTQQIKSIFSQLDQEERLVNSIDKLTNSVEKGFTELLSK